MQVQPLGREDPLEKETATHSSVSACKSRAQRSLAGYSPWGHKRFGHDLVTKQQHNREKLCIIIAGMGFPGGSEVKASARNVGDLGSIPVSGRSPGEGNGNPLQYSCLENPMDGGA